ncbi:MAG: radical SAM protein, partial [Akkermansiaceae bacterium]|nr:radical SAM protein [Akkermansiaceae bacterium]
AYLQGMLSMGDRRVSGVLAAMLQEPDWRKAAKQAVVEPDSYMMRHREFSERLPWDFIDNGLDRTALWER